MGTAVNRPLAVLVAFVFLSAALPGAVPDMLGSGPMTMTFAAFGQPCEHCPSQGSGRDIGCKKRSCDTLACAGSIVGLPSPSLLPTPAFGAIAFPMQAHAQPVGTTLGPSLPPPRQTSLV
jgi:hypothetical protein